MKHGISIADRSFDQLTTKLRSNGFKLVTGGITGTGYGIYQRTGVMVHFTAVFPEGYTGQGSLGLPIKRAPGFEGAGQLSISGYYTSFLAFVPQTGIYYYPDNSIYLPDPSGFTNYTAGGAIQVSGWYIAG